MQKKSPRILFVDDDEDLRLLVPSWLEKAGYEVVTADSLVSGLELARTQTFATYLLDSRFSDGLGRDLCEKIREFDDKTPIIFYTGETFERITKDMECGAQGYVIKPGLGELASTISQAIDDAV